LSKLAALYIYIYIYIYIYKCIEEGGGKPRFPFIVFVTTPFKISNKTKIKKQFPYILYGLSKIEKLDLGNKILIPFAILCNNNLCFMINYYYYLYYLF
tara:strand:- start:436 stop:729 length:294 start_codon:yes stop_codon:yes gene_type:complete